MARGRLESGILKGIGQRGGAVSGDINRLIRLLEITCTQRDFRRAISELAKSGKIRRDPVAGQSNHMKLTLRRRSK
jgi:hypothetical protein